MHRKLKNFLFNRTSKSLHALSWLNVGSVLAYLSIIFQLDSLYWLIPVIEIVWMIILTYRDIKKNDYYDLASEVKKTVNNLYSSFEIELDPSLGKGEYTDV